MGTNEQQEAMKTRQREVQFGEHMTPGRRLWRAFLTCGPAVLWVSIFLLLPLIAVGVISFMSRGPYGEVRFPLTIESYRRFAGFGALGFDPLYPIIVVRSFVMGALTTLLCLLAAVPLAFFIAGLPGRLKNLALLLVVIPFWTNLLIRTYAWQIIFAADGWLAGAAARLGLCPPDTPLYPGMMAIYVGMLCDYLPFMALPVYASVEKIDWSLAEAAMDLGADRRRVFLHAILPQMMPGLAAGIILVFIPATGQFVIPDLLGGAKTVMLGNAVAQQFGASRDWPFGSAIAFLGMGLVMLGLWAYARVARERGEEGVL